jgi:hypothetical protein
MCICLSLCPSVFNPVSATLTPLSGFHGILWRHSFQKRRRARVSSLTANLNSTSLIYWPIWVKFGTDNLHKILLIVCEFHKTGRSEGHSLPKDVPKVVPYCLHFHKIRIRPCQGDTKTYWVIVQDQNSISIYKYRENHSSPISIVSVYLSTRKATVHLSV